MSLNAIARAELRFPKRGSVHACILCETPGVFRFLGVRHGKGQWETLLPHTIEQCRATGTGWWRYNR